MREGNATSSSAGLGFNIGAYSIGGGISLSRSDNTSHEELYDVNGDGLPDRVIEGSPVMVAFNTGNGFTGFTAWNGANAINESKSVSEGASAYFTVQAVCQSRRRYH